MPNFSSLSSSNLVVLVFGSTGATGKHVAPALLQLLPAGSQIVLYVRDTTKINADILSNTNVTVRKGDFTNLEEVSRCITEVRPTSIIFTTSLARGSNAPLLNAVTVPTIVDTLRAEGRLNDVKLVYLGGFFSLPAGEPANCKASFLSCCCVPLLGISQGVRGVCVCVCVCCVCVCVVCVCVCVCRYLISTFYIF